LAAVVAVALLATPLHNCQWLGQSTLLHKQAPLPDLGPPIPLSARVELDPSVLKAEAPYVDSCGHPEQLRLGDPLEDALMQAAHQTFQTAYGSTPPPEAKPDVHVRIRLLPPELKVNTDAMYDRAPTELRLDALAEFYDQTGRLISETPLQTTRRERIQVTLEQRRCAYIIEPFAREAAAALSIEFMKQARTVLLPQTAAAPLQDTGKTDPASRSTAAPPTQPVPPRSAAAAIAPVPALVTPAAKPDTIDHIPPAAAGFHRPQTFLVSVGISTHRDPQLTTRKYGALDAEVVATYFQSLGGVPSPNVRLLVDMKALRADIEEAILDWLPARVTADSIAIVYFSGQAKVLPGGEVFLVPYEGGTSPARLYPLKDLYVGLSRLQVRQTVLVFDGAVTALGPDQKTKGKDPQWDPGGPNNIVRFIATSGLRDTLESDKIRHGLFTYYFLKGLKGEADENLDGEVTLGELGAFLQRAVPVAAKTAFNQDQRPLIALPSGPSGKPASVLLTKSRSE
jgi:hypothetical protein